MKGKLILLLILILLFAGFVAVRFFILDKQNVYGELKVISSPTASIFVNNVAVGKTPFVDKYKTGEYLLKLIPEGNATDTASWQGKIKIFKNVQTYVNREMGTSEITSAGEIFTVEKIQNKSIGSNFGEIQVETEPNGSIVYLDNEEKGVSPMLLADVPKGDHEVSVFMPGFFRRNQKINIVSGYLIRTNFKLSVDQSQKINGTKNEDVKTSSPSAILGGEKTTVVIKDTPTGFLRVREAPSLEASEAAQVKPGETFDFLDEKEGWYQIKYDGKTGWISSVYSEKKTQ